jgi:hypothetical protein
MKRRFFLQGLGGAMVAAPMLSTLVQKKARAAAAPMGRFIMFFTHNGCNTNKWFPTIENGPLTAADLSPTLAPLADVVDKLLLPRGFASLNPYGQRQTIDPHNQAMGSKLTCALIDEGRETNYATGISVDHFMAEQMNPGGASPLLLSVGQRSTSIKEVVSFSAPSTPYVSEVNPAVVYNQLTGLLSGAQPGEGMPAPATEGDYRLMRGQSVIDLVRSDLDRYAALNMGSSDKLRVEAWLSMLREAEVNMMGGGGMATASCNGDLATELGITDEAIAAAGTGVAGERSGAFVFGQQTSDAMRQSFTVGGDMMLNLIALSAVCDTNRVMGMVYPGYVIFDWDGITHQYDHHGISHRDGTLDVDNECVDGVMAMIAEIDNWYAGKYAKLVNLLNSIPEGDGTVLDNSAVTWINELSDGDAHNINNLPIIIAGSAGGKLKQGVAVNVEGRDIGQGGSENGCTSSMNTSGSTGSQGGNVPINKFYCTLLNAFGVTSPEGGEWTHFGQFDNNNKNGEDFTNPGQVDDLLA